MNFYLLPYDIILSVFPIWNGSGIIGVLKSYMLYNVTVECVLPTVYVGCGSLSIIRWIASHCWRLYNLYSLSMVCIKSLVIGIIFNSLVV